MLGQRQRHLVQICHSINLCRGRLAAETPIKVAAQSHVLSVTDTLADIIDSADNIHKRDGLLSVAAMPASTKEAIVQHDADDAAALRYTHHLCIAQLAFTGH